MRRGHDSARLHICALCTAAALLFAPTPTAWAKKGGASPEERAFEKALLKAAPKPAKKPRRRSRKKGAPASAAQAPMSAYSDGKAGGQLGSGRMRRANRVAARVLEARMRRYRRSDLMLIRHAGAADVVVVRGSYDRVQDVLRALQIKHVVVPPRLLTRIPLMSTQTLMINCPGRLGKKARAKVRRFVRTGGYLVTTDWALTMVQKAFPGTIARGKRNTKNDVVAVHLHKGHGKGMLRHVGAMKKSKPRWWLEASSYPIRVLNKKKVKVLISSKEMKKKYGHGAIAVLFRHDDGKVLHMTSHFYLQQGKLRTKREKAKGSAFAKAAGLDKKTMARLKKAGIDKVKAGDLNSAYSMQQMTANVLVNRQASKRRLLRKYRRRARKELKLQSKAAKKSKDNKRKVGKDFRVRVLKRKGKRVYVRDLFGNEGWTDDANLK